MDENGLWELLLQRLYMELYSMLQKKEGRYFCGFLQDRDLREPV